VQYEQHWFALYSSSTGAQNLRVRFPDDAEVCAVLDHLLSWVGILAPFAFSVVPIFIPAKTEDKRLYMKWRYVLVAFGILCSVLAGWQQERVVKAAATDRESAITETSERVATNTAAKVADTLNKQYGSFISDLYKEMGRMRGQMQMQAGLRKEEIELNYAPAADIVYAGDRLQIWNRGRTSLSLWGDKYDGESADMTPPPVVIGPTDYYYILADKLQALAIASLGKNGEARVPVDFYFTTADKQKYILHCTLWEVMKDSNLNIHSQCHGFEHKGWTKPLQSFR
jgi:hypothetical protein